MADILPPLVLDGRILAIPRASATQDGYLSRDDFILFSGGTIVPVTSFNTRTGEVVLLEDDVLAALGYVPLNKHGDTMTGPLILPAVTPSSPLLSAATKQYVDTHAGGGSGSALLPSEYLATDFNASGSKLKFTGTIAAGLLTRLTLTAASDFAPGQGIFVAGAGASGAALITKVDAIDATLKIITLHDAATSPVTSVNVQHDDTVALQTAINTVWNDGGGTIYIAAGFYRINGPFTDYNSILKLPYSPTNGGPIINITLVGTAPVFPAFMGPQTSGTIIQTDKQSAGGDADGHTGGSMLAAAAWGGEASIDWTTVNNVFLNMEGICWRTYDNPNISALDLGNCGMVDLKNITVDTGVKLVDGAQPTHQVFGIRLNRTAAAGINNTHNVFVCNYWWGFVTGEIWTMTGTIVPFRCMVGYRILEGFNAVGGICRMTVGWCRRVIEVAAQTNCLLDITLHYEADTTGNWYSDQGEDIYDPGNKATGIVRYFKMNTVGPTRSALAGKVGGANLSIISLSGLEHRIAGPLSVTGLLSGDIAANSLSFLNQPVTMGIDNSGGTGYRALVVANTTGAGGERSKLFGGIEAPFTGSNASLATGLVSFWNLNEATGANPVVDSQGTNPLTITASPVSVSGRINTALSFNGTTQYLGITDAAQVGLSGGNVDYTISFWVYLTDKSRDHHFVTKTSTGAPAWPYLIEYEQSGDVFFFATMNTDSTYNICRATTFGSPPVNAWIFVCAWFNSTAHTLNIQINNGAISTLDITGKTPRTEPGTPFYVMAYAPPTSFAAGRIDAIGFWNRVLTP
jgi:hypothetical protein